MKRIILILCTALVLSSCIKEDTYCPVMYLSFHMEDEFVQGDYDSRIGHEVLLYIFKDDILTYSECIPYGSIAEGKEYSISKTPEILGNLKIVAWAVPLGETETNEDGTVVSNNSVSDYHPDYEIGDKFDDKYLEHIPMGMYDEDDHYYPYYHELYIGRMDVAELDIDRETHHRVVMHPAPGRIAVNIKDPDGFFAASGSEPHVVVSGIMSRMNLDKKGDGTPVKVRSALNTVSATRAEDNYGTGHFGVLPSQQGQTLSIDIMAGDQKVETLRVFTDDNLHESIESGELLEFDYTVGANEFTITVGSWRRSIRIVNGM